MSTPISDPNGTDNQTELKPCPFCGTVPSMSCRAKGANHTKLWIIECEDPNCFAYSTSGFGRRADAITSWNKRAEISVSEGEQRDLGEKEPPSDHVNAVLQKARQLIDHLDAIHDDPRFKAVWTSYANHGLRYEGPFYVDELSALRDAVEYAEKVILSEQGGEQRAPFLNQNQSPSPSLPASKAGEETQPLGHFGLWKFFRRNHGLLLTDSEMDAIIRAVHDLNEGDTKIALSGLTEADVNADQAAIQKAREAELAPSFCGVAGHFKFQQNGSSCLMCQREAQLMRKTWEAGMRLARSYGDNFMYCEGAEKERHWDKLLLSIKLNEEQPAPLLSENPASAPVETGDNKALEET